MTTAGTASSGTIETLARTSSGRVRGELSEGIHAFRGIPYGASTAGTNRFMPPVQPMPWTGVRDASGYGPIAPQTAGGTTPIEDSTGREDEDCLVLNVFTPGLSDGVLRPVMFWCHGGGFRNGSGGPAYDGSNLARRGEVVVVSINHRLNALGYLHLGDMGDEAFAASGNAGMLDIVAALAWVRDNIAEFGGDARNVTIFGESGGGRKVAALLAMPAAKGLFHKAIIESGPGIRVNEREYATRLADLLLAELGLGRHQLRELQQVPVQRLMAAQLAVAAKVPSAGDHGGFRPVIDPAGLPRHPFDPTAPEISSDIPVLIGFNRTEATLFLANDATVYELDEVGMRARAVKLFKDRADFVVESMRACYPEASPSDLYILMDTGSRRYPIDSIKLAERKATGGGAPAYMYKFQWETTARWGKLKTPHAIEIPFVFDNVSVGSWGSMTRGTPEAHALAAKVSATWAAFARTGSPNGGGLPEWERYGAARKTMVIDNESMLVDDPAADERRIWEAVYYG